MLDINKIFIKNKNQKDVNNINVMEKFLLKVRTREILV